MSGGSRFLAALIVALALHAPCRAERLAIRFLGPAEGLPHTRVRAITADPRGFLWFSTPEGLARFDGSAVRVYDKSDGLPVVAVNDLLATRDGAYLLATDGAGVWRLDPQGTLSPCSMEHRGATSAVRVLHEDREARIWAGTQSGLFVRDPGDSSFRGVPEQDGIDILSFADDPDGSLWIGTGSGLARRLPGGRTLRYTMRGYGSSSRFRALTLDGEGRLWIGHEHGLVVLARRPLAEIPDRADSDRVIEPLHVALRDLDQTVELPDTPDEARTYTSGDDLTRNAVRRVVRLGDGKIGIAQVGRGLTVYDGRRFARYDRRHGLRDETLNDIVEDRAGGLWLASDAGGAMRVAWDGLASFGAAEGLGHTFMTGLFEHPSGAVVAVAGNFRISVFDGRAFDAVTRALPPGVGDLYFWEVGWMTRAGEWWVPTARGLHRFAPSSDPRAIGSTRPLAIYRGEHGMPGSVVGELLEDRVSDVWLSVLDGEAPLVRWIRGADRFVTHTTRDGLPAATITALAESPRGTIWLGFGDGRIGRRTAESRFELLPSGTGVPNGRINELYFDATGRLWIATEGGGLGRVEDPESGNLAGRTFGRADGLSSESVRCLVEDRYGRVYAGTARGIHRVTGERIARLAAADGLANDEVRVALRDRHGDLWFGTLDGVSRLRPRMDRGLPPPEVFIGSIRVDGVSRPVAEIGAAELEELNLPPGGSHLQIDYFALTFVPGDAVRYEYRLDGADRGWNVAGTMRSVTYANLAAGRYRFEVRATDSTGAETPRPAQVAWIVRPPFWRTRWFGGLVVALAVTVGWAVHRIRLARALAVERLRTRIATDLHDDIGSNLTHVTILSEVALRRLGESGTSAAESLSRIAQVSRETIDTMGDIVWAIDPGRDRLGDLVFRMRRFANDLFAARPIPVRFTAPSTGLEKRLGAGTKRHLYRVFKESLHNAVRHSDCTEVQVSVTSESAGLRLAVRDDGQGFAREAVVAGAGLDSMRARAEAMGGKLDIRTRPGGGTEIVLDIPWDRSTA